MSENKVIIPCEVLKRITPLLEKSINYEHVMFIKEFQLTEAIFLVGKVTDDTEKLKQGTPYYLTEDEMNFFLRKRKTADFIPDYTNIYDFVLSVGNNFVLPVLTSPNQPAFTTSEFDKLWDSYKLPHDDYYYSFLVLIAVFAKYIYTHGTFEGEVYVPDDYFVRGEKLKLAELLCANATKEKTGIKISYNGKSVMLDNWNGWFKKMIYASLEQEMDIAAIRKELKEKYSTKGKAGRKTKKGQCNVLLSAYNLIHQTSLKTGSVILNDQEAFFMIDFLKYLQLHDQKKEMDAVYMRALLSHYQAEKALIKWWSFE